MPTLRKTFVLLLWVLISQSCGATQGGSPSKEEPGAILARLSYSSTYFVVVGKEKLLQSMCFEIYGDGHFRMVRRTTNAAAENRAGMLSEEQLDLIRKMLMKLDFNSSPGGVIRKGSESFTAEISSGGETKRFLWVDPDHQRPFPDSVARIIGWVQDFKSQDASPFIVPELSTDPICPSTSKEPVLPVFQKRVPCH